MASIPGCGTPVDPRAQAAALANVTPEVTVAVPIVKTVRDFEDFTGRTEAVDYVEIRARVTGFLQETHFVDGDEVPKGKSLFTIDPRQYDADEKAASAELDHAVAARELANTDFVRVKALRDKGQVSAEEFDRTAAKKLEAEADVDAARAKLDQAKLNVEFAHVTAPIAGRMSRAEITDGNLVTADTTRLTTIVSVEKMYVYFDVDERSMLRFQRMIRTGEAGTYKGSEIKVHLGLVLDEGFPHEGTIDFVENRLDPSTGTIRIRAVFDNPLPEKGPRMLSPGLFARIRVPLGKEYPALHIPERAIGTDQGQKFVYVVGSNNMVEYRRVQLGPLHEGLRVVREGLSPTERIIVNGLQRVRPNSEVRVREAEASTSDDEPATRSEPESSSDEQSSESQDKE